MRKLINKLDVIWHLLFAKHWIVVIADNVKQVPNEVDADFSVYMETRVLVAKAMLSIAQEKIGEKIEAIESEIVIMNQVKEALNK